MIITAQNLIAVCGYTVEEVIPTSPTQKIYKVQRTDPISNQIKLATFCVNSKDNFIQGTHFGWKEEDKRAQYIENALSKAADILEAKARRKRRQEAEAENVQVGDIYVAQYGYEANFCDFMQVIEKKGTRVKVKALAKQSLFGSDYDANGSPHRISSAVKDNFELNVKTYSKPLHGESFKHNGHYYYKWNGKSITEYNDH